MLETGDTLNYLSILDFQELAHRLNDSIVNKEVDLQNRIKNY